jgi:hypothetical protein
VTNEPVFYLTFSTTRPFSVRPTGGTQIWMTPFYRTAPPRMARRAAFRMPFQLPTSATTRAWTQPVVISRTRTARR